MLRRAARWLWNGDGPVALSTVPVSALLLVAIVVLFIAERLSGTWQYDVTNLRHALGWSKYDIAHGEWWRALTSGLLHSDTHSPIGPLGLTHLLANAVALVVLAPRFERRFGSPALLGAFAVLHVAAFDAWILFDTRIFFGVGASGGLIGLNGVLLVDAFRRRHEEPTYLTALVLFTIWWWLVPAPRIATTSNQVHLVGFAVGVALGLALGDRSRHAMRIALAVIGVAAVLPLALQP